MNCPFLEEIVVRYCTAYPVKKMIPATVFDNMGVCHSDFKSCPVFKEWQADIDKKEEKMEKSGEKLCIWAKIGVISYRLCTQDYNCQTCEFDQQLREGKYEESPLIAQAIKKMKLLPAHQRQCRYMLTGDIPYKICANNYECWHCEVDQRIQDIMEFHPAFRRRSKRFTTKQITIEGIRFATSRAYTLNHFWVLKTERDTVRIGFDDFAQNILGPAEKISLTETGKLKVKTKFDSIDFEIPIGGRKIKLNNRIKENIKFLNTKPFHCWLVEIDHPEYETKDLKEGTEAQQWLKKEIDRMREFSEQEIGVTAADGGKPLSKIYKHVDKNEWMKLVNRFLTRG